MGHHGGEGLFVQFLLGRCAVTTAAVRARLVARGEADTARIVLAASAAIQAAATLRVLADFPNPFP